MSLTNPVVGDTSGVLSGFRQLGSSRVAQSEQLNHEIFLWATPRPENLKNWAIGATSAYLPQHWVPFESRHGFVPVRFVASLRPMHLESSPKKCQRSKEDDDEYLRGKFTLSI